MTKFVYYLQIKQIYSRALITALVGIKIICLLTVTYVRINFFGYLEITTFQRMRIYIFIVQDIRNLHVQISLFSLKCTSSNYLCTWHAKSIQFVVANYLANHIEGVSYIRLERILCKRFWPLYCECLSFGFVMYGF
jgi:hypothetical protein